MKKAIWALFLALSLALGATPRAAIPFSGKTLDGRPFDLKPLLGKTPIFLHFWASHCPPCLIEGKEIEPIHQRFKGRIAFVAVDVQDPPKMAAFRVREWGWTFPVVVDYYADVARAYGVRALPTSVFIDRAGRVEKVWTGMLIYNGRDGLTRLLKELLNAP